MAGKQISSLFVRLGLDDKELQTKLNKAQKTMGAWGKNMAIAGGAILGAVAGIGGASLKMAADYDSAMREVNTMMQLGESEFNEFSDQVKELAASMGVDATKAAEALYQAISAGVPQENAIDFLRVATKAAIGGVTDTETAVDGLTTVLNAFKIPVEDAQRVADIMFTTVKGGKTTMEELSASLFNVAPVANAFGVSLEEVSAALATMTKQGVPTTQATTQLRQVILALSAPTTEAKKLMEEMGLEMSTEHLEAVGLAGVMQELLVVTDGDASALRKLVGSTEAVSGILALTGENAVTFAADLETMNNSAGAATDAFNQMEQSTSRQMESLKSSVTDMAISIGQSLMPILNQVIEMVKPIIETIGNWIKENPELTKTLFLVAGAVGALLLVLGTLGMIIGPLAAAFTLLLGPVGLVIAAIAALAAIGIVVWNNWDKIGDFFKNLWEGIKNAFSSALDWIKEYGLYFLGMPGLIIKHWGDIVEFFKGLPEKIGEAFAKVKDYILAPFRLAWEGIEKGINWLISMLNKIKFNIPDWVPGIGGKGWEGFNIAPIKLPSFAGWEGQVPGRLGQPYPAIVHGGEVISQPGSQSNIDRMVADAIRRGLAGMMVKVEVGGKDVAAIVSREQLQIKQYRV